MAIDSSIKSDSVHTQRKGPARNRYEHPVLYDNDLRPLNLGGFYLTSKHRKHGIVDLTVIRVSSTLAMLP